MSSDAARLIVDADLRTVLAADLPWNEFHGTTVLITGANGFLASAMVETLLALNATGAGAPVTVIAQVRTLSKAQARFARYIDRPELQLLMHDVTGGVPPVEHVDFVIHAASQASPRFYHTDPVGTLNANVLGTNSMLALARRDAAKFLLFSSGDVYGMVAEVPTREDVYGPLDPMAVRSCYGESKRMAENMCASWAHQYDVEAKVVRPYHTYGPGIALDDGRVFSDLVSDVVHRRDLVLSSDGSATRAFCYLADATAGFFTVLLRGGRGEAYNVGNQAGELSIAALAELLAGLYPERGLAVRRAERSGPYVASPVHRSAPEVSKMRDLGWVATTTPEVGFHRTIRWAEAAYPPV